jgi:hypothetical protein
MLELDHIFCLVNNLDRAADRLGRDGWTMDGGSVHSGQGTRNRRIRGPSAASVPSYAGPQIVTVHGPHHLELVVGDGPTRPVTEILTIRG